MPERYEFQITEEDAKRRLDEFLFGRFFHLSKMFLRECIKNGKCEVNGGTERPAYLLRKNDFIEFAPEYGERQIIEPEPIPLEIIFEDADLIVVNKPAGMLAHPTVRIRKGTLLNGLTFHLNRENGNRARAGLIHRLDKETSGLLVAAKNPQSHRILSAHFKRKLVEKKYFAVVEGSVKRESSEINAPIGRFDDEKIWNVKADGKEAETRFSIRKRFENATLLELEPVTGRTNQLRIHTAFIGHPIIGDVRYGGRAFGRLCLHAYKLSFFHPNGGTRLEFEISLPEVFTEIGKNRTLC